MSAKDVPSELIRAKDVRAFDVWALPTFESSDEEPAYRAEVPPGSEPLFVELEVAQVEDVEVESVKPLTLEELEAIRQDAYNEGFSVGEKDGFHAGQLKAKQEAEVALQGKLQRLEQVMSQLLEPIAEQDQQLEQALANPEPEIRPELARQVRPEAMPGTVAVPVPPVVVTVTSFWVKVSTGGVLPSVQVTSKVNVP